MERIRSIVYHDKQSKHTFTHFFSFLFAPLLSILTAVFPYLSFQQHMPYRNLEPVSKQLTIVVGLTVVGFMAFGLALSYYRNALFEQTLLNMKKQNVALSQHIENSYRDLEYYRSDQYKNKYAKEKLSLVSPGEKVLIIQQSTPGIVPDGDENEALQQQREAAYLELLQQMPILEHWKLYLFQRNKVEMLKRAL